MENNADKRPPLIDRGAMPVIILTLVTMFCVAALALVSNLTSEARAQQEAEAALSIQRELFPAASEFKEISLEKISPDFANITQIVEAVDSSGSRLGFVITATGMGYGGPIPTTVGYDTEGKIVGTRFDVSAETAGYGQNAAKPRILRTIHSL